MEYRYRILDRERCYQGFLGLSRYRLRHELFAGGESAELLRERIESFSAASVLLYDPQRDQVVMIEQFRIGALERPAGPWVLEVIGGIIEPGETPEQVARREALEEAGCRIGALEPVCSLMVSPGYSTERIHLFCGRVDASRAGGIHGVADEGEDIRVRVLAADQMIDGIRDGMVDSTSSIIAAQWLALNRDRLRREWSE